MIRKGKLRGGKVLYPDGVGCCVWYPFSSLGVDDDDESGGLAWDFSFEDIDDLIALLQEMKEAEPEVFEE